MGARYSINGAQTVANPTDSVLGLTSSTLLRPRIYDIIFGQGGTASDNQLEYLLSRYTAVGTGTSVTPQSLDPDEVAANSSALEDHTAEPTYTAGANLLRVVTNTRAAQRWVAVPGGELLVPATVNAGIGVQPIHGTYTGEATVTMHFEE